MTKPKSHPEDRMLADMIAGAVEFTAHLRIGPFEKYTERRRTYPEALAAARELETAHSRFGRSAMVYAITAKGYTVPCSPELAAVAGVTK